MDTTEVRSSSLDFTEIAQLADQGMLFVGCKMGMSSSRWLHWQDRATNNKFMLLDWLKGGSSVVTVARRGHSFVLDIDDPAECERLSFKREWLDGYYAVDTPSGGEHHHGLHDVTTETLENVINVYRVKGVEKSGKILELKLHNQSVAAPTAERFADEKKCAGIYEPRVHGAKMRRGIDPELKAWLEEHGEVSQPHEKSGATRIDFHPRFDMERFLAQHDCTEDRSGMVDGALHILVESCPICGKEARESTVPAGITKFIFGGYSFGFVCHACGINSKDELEEKLSELVDGFEPWNEFIYEDDDPEFLLSSFGAEKADEGATSADTLPETAYLSSKASFPESVSTADTADDPVRYSDAGNAMRLAQNYGNDILYCRQSDEYYVWDGARWVRDLNNVRMLQMAKAVTEQMFSDAETLGEDAAKALRSHALKSQSVARLSGMVSLAKTNVRNIDLGEFDKDQWLFNCVTGTIELRTGKCREHRHEDLISKLAPVRYDPAADCPPWKKCLSEWMLGDDAKVGYLQRLAGYTMTGCTNEEVMPILWGAGRNGKTKFYVTIYNALGDGEYAKAANFDSFVVKKGDEGMPNDIAGWCGMRLIVAAEGEHSKRLAEAKLKLCIGRDPVVGEFKYQEEFTYIPTYKVWLVTNPKPRIVGTTEAIWDKIHFVAWNRYFRPEERDTELQEKLNAELPGILNWMIEGCLEWQKKGLALPASMRQDTDTYRNEQDVVGRFVDEECEVGEKFTSPKLTYQCFKDWAEDAGEHYTMAQVEFNEKMLGRFAEARSKSGRFWRGFKLKRHDSDFESSIAEQNVSPESLEQSIQ